jgi:pSer/pThr/pTyr-binding forkhead associated (FHA) protein
MAKLTIESGAEARTIPLSDPCRIGRDEGNEVAVNDSGASRRHCRITRSGDGWLLEDLQSANGTFRNGERIDKARLADGDEVRIGATTLRFHASDEPAAAAAESDEIRLEEPGGAVGSGGQGEAQAGFVLLFTAGDKKGERIPLGATRVTVGRKQGNTVVLRDPKVSGVHAEILLEGGRPVVRDLGSTNGTFLEGKRIEELVLSHGDRLQIGDSELVLTDVTKPDPTFSATRTIVDDAGATLVDVPTVRKVAEVPRRKSPLAALGLLLLVAGIGAGGYFLYQQRRGAGPARVEAPPPAGNLLGARWSFESGESGESGEAGDDAIEPSQAWNFQDGSAASFGVEPGGRSGSQSIVAEPAGGTAVASLVQGIPVDPRERYGVAANVRCSGDAVGLAAASFRNADDPTYRVDIGLGGSSEAEWRELRGEIVPPSGATELVLQLLAVGASGSVAFDDVSVVEAGAGRPDVRTVNGFDFELAGRNLLVRRGADLLRIAGLVFGAGGTAHDADRFLSTTGSGTGRVALQTGAALDSASRFEVENGAAWRRVEWSGATVDSVTLPITLLPALLEDAVGVIRAGRYEPFFSSFHTDAVEGLVLGRGATRLRVTFDPPVAIHGEREAAAFRLAARPPVASGRLTIRFQVDFVAEKTEALALLGQAKAAETAGRLGEALAVVDRIQNEFPFDDALLAEAAGRRQEIEREGQRLDARLQAAIGRAAFLKSVTAYDEAQAEATALVKAYAGTPGAQRYEQALAELAASRETLVREAEQRRAQQLLARLETVLAQDPTWSLAAREIADELAQKYPWSDAARRAAELVKDAR